MHKHELPELSQRLSQLADALGGRAPSPAGLLVWGDALAECSRDDVLAVLSDWPKTHSKMPLPAEVLKLCRERLSDRIEREARTRAARGHDDWDIEPSVCANVDGEAYRQFTAFVRSLTKTPRNPKAWSLALRDREEAGERLNYVQSKLWRDALGEQIEAPEADELPAS